jgi:hypothetical protein
MASLRPTTAGGESSLSLRNLKKLTVMAPSSQLEPVDEVNSDKKRGIEPKPASALEPPETKKVVGLQ